ncbi:hypothetical protein [Pseudaminobacter soli (ex Zhang et al. 2022)]|uniref:hypothetical protein n=1 Tax=Pseudaminobacter soli (ex Zhang et al. 2022) TaxID=2831468 RepID=UPI001F16857A|nr:hypothetical protein [Pseudaminobacter soli]
MRSEVCPPARRYERGYSLAHAVAGLPPVCASIDYPLFEQPKQAVILPSVARFLFGPTCETAGSPWDCLTEPLIDLVGKITEQRQAGSARYTCPDHEHEATFALRPQK